MNNIAAHTVTRTGFFDLAGVELKRAERYRIFVSLAVLDLGFLKSVFGDHAPQVVDRLTSLIGDNVRAMDTATLLENDRVALLFPETSRQNAGIAALRISGMVRHWLKEYEGVQTDEMIAVEMASYPDAGGTKTISGFLEELAAGRRN
jgi:hypothetical protein